MIITLRRENRIVRVSENELEKYLSKGYTQVSVEQTEAPRKPIEEVKLDEPKVDELVSDTDFIVKDTTKTTQTRTRRKK